MKLKFTKMQGLGNDYLYVYGAPEQPKALARRLSDRHFGVGSDGLILIGPSQTADFSMRIFNADGSEAAMCGNGIRCVGKFLFDKGYTEKTELTVDTKAGPRRLTLHTANGTADSVTVDMGTVTVGRETENGLPVNVGNPHLVIFVPDVQAVPLTSRGPELERSVPGGVNVEFVQVLDSQTLRMRVWERGSGVTLACGTGACAAAAAAAAKGLCPRDTPITLRLDGGTLTVTVTGEGRVWMQGPAVTVFEGELEL